MKAKLFISTAGIGSRVSGLGVVPNKSLLPINYEAIISKILDKFDNDIEVIVALGHHAELVKNFLKLAHPEKKIKFVKIGNILASGAGYTLNYCKNIFSVLLFIRHDTLTIET